MLKVYFTAIISMCMTFIAFAQNAKIENLVATTQIQVRILPFSFITLPENKVSVVYASQVKDYSEEVNNKDAFAAKVLSNQNWIVNVNTEHNYISEGRNIVKYRPEISGIKVLPESKNEINHVVKLIYTTTQY